MTASTRPPDLAAFTAAVAADVARALDAAQAAVTLTPLVGDASTRRYYRAVAGGQSAIVMRLPADALKSDEVTAGDRPAELPFVNVHRLLAAAGVPVPRLYADRTAAGYLVLEDLGDETLEVRLNAAGGDRGAWRGLYDDALELLARFKSDAGAALPGSDCLAATRRFDAALLRWELDHFTEWGVEAGTGKKYSAAARRIVETAFDDIVTRLLALPAVLTHRDFQSRNIMLRGGRMVLLDFQDALLGPAVYDVVALLRDSYIVLPPALLEQLLGDAHRVLRGAPAIPESETEFRRQFHLQTLQRKLKDAGRFVFIDRVRKNPSFLRFVPSSLDYVRQAFAASGEYGELRRVLADYRPELAP